GRVAECTGANIFFINDGKIHTPIADCFLDGITRQTVIELAKRRGIEVIERRIMPDELTQFSECFITGSAAEVTAGSQIPHLEIAARRHHPATQGRLHRRGAAQGQEEGGLIRRRWPLFSQSRITTSRSVPDSPPHASPGRPSIWRTFAFFLSLGNVV